MALFGRKWKITAGDVDVSAFDPVFDIVKSTAREPNTCEVTLRNLSAATRARIENASPLRVVVRAGYEEDGDPPPLLFNGDARHAFSDRDGLEIVTTIQASDGGRDLQTARISRSYPPGTEVAQVLRDTVDALGIGAGNLADFVTSYESRNGSRTFPDGFAAAGPARRVLQGLTRAAGLRWSVQNGALQLLRVGQPLQETAVRLSAASGLVGSPTRSFDGPGGRRVKVTAQALIRPGLEPGRRIVLDSEGISGGFEIRRTVCRGGATENDWYANLELAPL